jgi:aryl-alcohol dehydrogenase-like predicted oxidoreductase
VIVARAADASGRFAIGGDMPVTRMGLGAMRLCGPNVWGEAADPEGALAVLRRAVEIGIDFIDTAEAYGPKVNERQIADALHPYAPGLVIATKCGLVRTWQEGTKYPNAVPDGRPEAIRASIEGSLSRLKIERIDLYQLHRIDPNVPLEESVGTLGELRREGKVRHVGLSEVSAEQLARAQAVTAIGTVQNKYNLLDRGYDDVLAACEATGVGFMPWFPLAGGRATLAGQPAIGEAAAKHGASAGQVALAWLLHRSPNMLLIPGTSSIPHLEENVAAAALRLDTDDMAALGGLSAA